MTKSASLASRIANAKNSSTPNHLIVIARAGTGKTTTLIEGLKVLRGEESEFTPSTQQEAIWYEMAASRQARSICFVAFNKSIATELQQRVPKGCDAMTMHSMGMKAVRKAFELSKVNGVHAYRVDDIISEITGKDCRELRKDQPELLNFTKKLVSLCKQNLVDHRASDIVEQLGQLASYYDLDLNGEQERIFELVPKVLERCLDVPKDACIDFDDMIWLPVALNLNVFKYDLLLVDEAQDLNRCQQQLALKAGRRLILCGDPSQAIYGFAGADSESLTRMETILKDTTGVDVTTLPLTVTRRCGIAIVKEAQRLVPDFDYFEGNGEGKVQSLAYDPDSKNNYAAHVKDGDMVLCRTNAPLVSQCFSFIRKGRKANIQGRDIGAGLISTIKKLKATSIDDLLDKLDKWYDNESKKEQRKKNPSDARMIALSDRYECLGCFVSEATTVEGVIKKIEAIFTDQDTAGIKLSSGHKSKGLEASNVFLLMPKEAPCPHPMAKTPWQVEQEYNLLYVMITRAIECLTYVR